MGYFLGLIAALTGLWLGLSGHYTPLVLSLGAVSILLSAILAYRLDILDREGSPYGRLVQLMAYWAWLLVEIFKANWVVIKACLRADLDINPALVKVKTTCESDLAKTVFANSITLTPGTVSVNVEGDKILVHALYEDQAQPEAFVEMDRRSRLASDGRGHS
ncbi:MAG: Na+/H+ antiporter subunit E [Alphaproteobacteria bacterium]|nr:Na+/H+ antiporter subunit E [Alphaproteobacteria bacterium]